MFTAPEAGFFGKLPAQADFVHAGLPATVITALDLWCRESLLALAPAIGPGWRDAWMVAPVWHFWLPPGGCGPHALLGAWMPGMDRVGRCYPFIACAYAPTAAALAGGAGWLEQVSAAALRCVVEDAGLDTLRAQMARPASTHALPAGPGWWTAGAPGRRPGVMGPATLPSPHMAADMIVDNASSNVSTEVR
ncbi:hypothetical protein GLUCOINTEAF2_0203028 [Komagataeibacter intermedius AF2]|uniref:Type VI secretion system protein ImpM n=1 Tax=Komagataeibacter intermedius AF2 TaxID=1458464 RepID=A0A0N1FMS0_9PROT|nr:type VI secretion system-associated protein TagF [Komagataeibacter intermedius]KPH85991.1 hypothetical protein GLUCOINTEAF2_0203028 [Komagataeibacter intermedius AF2]